MLGTVLVHGVHEVNQTGKAPWSRESALLQHCFLTQHSFPIWNCFKPSPLSINPINTHPIPLEEALDPNFTEEPEATRWEIFIIIPSYPFPFYLVAVKMVSWRLSLGLSDGTGAVIYHVIALYRCCNLWLNYFSWGKGLCHLAHCLAPAPNA